jgi:hypothetical protein
MAAALALLLTTALLADEPDDLAALPKDEFVRIHEENFLSILNIAEELMVRVDADFDGIIDATSPITVKERDAFACVYDHYANAGQLSDLALQITLMEPLRDRMANDPGLNYVDLLINEALQEELMGSNPEAMVAANRACEGVLILSDERFKPSPAFWTTVQEAFETGGVNE